MKNEEESSAPERPAPMAASRAALKEWWTLLLLRLQLRSDSEGLREQAVKKLGEIGTSTVLAPLRAAVKDKGPGVRRAAATALGKIGDIRAEDALLAALGDSKRTVRIAAASALGAAGTARSAGPLAQAMRDKDSEIRGAAVGSLIKLRLAATDVLIAALTDPDEAVRKVAVQALGRINDPTAIEPLVVLLKQGDSSMQEAATALSELGWRPSLPEERVLFAFARGMYDEPIADGPAAVPPLIAALQKDSNVTVRRAAARALGEIRDERAVEPLLAVLQSVHETGDMRAAATLALGRLGGQPAIEALVSALMSPDEEIEVREAAARGLGEAGDPAVINPLVAALRFPEHVIRQAAVESLGRTDHPMVIAPLMRALTEDVRHSVRKAAADALVKQGTAVVESLATTLNDPQYQTRVIGVQALGQMADAAAVPPLLRALEDENEQVRREAVKALGQIGDPAAVEPLLAAFQDESWEVSQATVRAFGQMKELRAVAPMLNLVTDDRLAEDIVSALRMILEEKARDVPLEELQQIARLQNTIQQSQQQDSMLGPSGPAQQVDCAPVKQLAKAELSRRGIDIRI